MEYAVSDVAVILIDLQRAIVERSPEGMGRHITAAARQLADAARFAGCPVFWIRVTRRKDGGDRPQAVTDIVPISTPIDLSEGSSNVEIAPDLHPQPEDYIITKHGRSAFIGTDLDRTLRRLKRNTLLLGGVATNWGVESTARDA